MTVRERPIIFSASMVKAIIAGAKTQTRRLVTVPWKGPRRAFPYEPYWVDNDGRLEMCDEYGDYHPAEKCLGRWGIGDRLWVKETWFDDCSPPMPGDQRERYEDGRVEYVEYRASHDCGNWEAGCPCNPDGDGKRSEWRPSIYMPRWASRIMLDIADVRIERLQAISEADALAEGVDHVWCGETKASHAGCCDHRGTFRKLWDSINGSRAPWSSNPWVWAISFRRVTP